MNCEDAGNEASPGPPGQHPEERLLPLIFVLGIVVLTFLMVLWLQPGLLEPVHGSFIAESGPPLP